MGLNGSVAVNIFAARHLQAEVKDVSSGADSSRRYVLEIYVGSGDADHDGKFPAGRDGENNCSGGSAAVFWKRASSFGSVTVVELLLVLLAVLEHLITTKAVNMISTHPAMPSGFVTFAPQLGQVFAFVLTCFPHSLQSSSAMLHPPELAALPPFLFVLGLAGRQFLPLHVARIVSATGAERDDVIRHVAGAATRRFAGRRAGVAALECPALGSAPGVCRGAPHQRARETTGNNPSTCPARSRLQSGS